MFTTPDGNLVAVSRPSFGDVVWIDLATNKIVAEQQMDGFRTDHMQVSPDGKRLLVSDSTSKQVIEFALGGRGQSWTGKRIRTFTACETPPETQHTQDGERILTPRTRPALGDVVWSDLATNKIVAEQQMDGFRTDHMQVSPDGKRLLVSDSTSKQVIEFALGGRGQSWTGKRIRTFTSGETPHESNYTKDGERIFHASIGRVYTPLDAGALGTLGDLIKADRWFQILRNPDSKVLRRWDMGKELSSG